MVEQWESVSAGPLGTRMIRFLDRYPKVGKIYVTSAMDGDHGSVSHHYGLWYNGSRTAAIDIGASSAKKMRDVARWLYDNFADFTVELIHTTPFEDDDGFYVKNQMRYPGGAIYGKATRKAHRDHVHWATSADLMTAIERVTDPSSLTRTQRTSKASGAEGEALSLSAAERGEILQLVRDLGQQTQRLEELVSRGGAGSR